MAANDFPRKNGHQLKETDRQTDRQTDRNRDRETETDKQRRAGRD